MPHLDFLIKWTCCNFTTEEEVDLLTGGIQGAGEWPAQLSPVGLGLPPATVGCLQQADAALARADREPPQQVCLHAQLQWFPHWREGLPLYPMTTVSIALGCLHFLTATSLPSAMVLCMWKRILALWQIVRLCIWEENWRFGGTLPRCGCSVEESGQFNKQCLLWIWIIWKMVGQCILKWMKVLMATFPEMWLFSVGSGELDQQNKRFGCILA